MAVLMLLVVRRLTDGFGPQLGVALDAAIATITVAAALWLAVGIDPQAALLRRWRRWASIVG